MTTHAGFRRCRCGQSWAAHNLYEAAAIAGVSHDLIWRRVQTEGIGQRIRGKWHFRRSDLRGITKQKPGPARTVPYTTPSERARYYYRKNLEHNRARIRAYHQQYKAQIAARRRWQREAV